MRSKKWWSGAVTGLIVGAGVATCGVAAADSQISAYLVNSIKFDFDGKQVSVPSEYVTLGYQDHTYVPARFVAEQLGATVEWDGDTRTIHFKKDSSVFNPTGDSSSNSNSGNKETNGSQSTISPFKSYSLLDGDITLTLTSVTPSKFSNNGDFDLNFKVRNNTTNPKGGHCYVDLYDASEKKLGEVSLSFSTRDGEEQTSHLPINSEWGVSSITTEQVAKIAIRDIREY